MNLDVTADESCLDPHVSCVQTSHPAAPLDVNAEQRSVRQSMMSGPHRADSAHTLTTFGTSGKFIRASRSGVASDSGRPQEPLKGLRDVICLDDTPSVLHNLRVHPVGQPDTVALVAFDQLALYDDQ
jgi:hypothetical protein